MSSLILAPEEFSSRLRALRKAHGWTIAELAVRASVDPSTVERIEAGSVRPRRLTHDALIAALEKDTSAVSIHDARVRQRRGQRG